MRKTEYIKHEPYVGEEAIYIPAVPWAAKGEMVPYKALITKDLFVEAYNKWIKNATAEKSNLEEGL